MNKTEYVQYALRHYTVPLFNEDEFIKDLNKIVVLKKIFRRFTTYGTINERLVLNNIIILLNVFGIEAANVLLFHNVSREHWGLLKPFLVFLNSYNGPPGEIDDIEMNEVVITKLGEIRWQSHSQR